MKAAKKFPFLALQRQRLQLFFNNYSSVSTPSEQQFYRWIWHTIKNHHRRANISLLLLDEEDARDYNYGYRGKDYATNVLSFALDEGENFQAHTPNSPTLSGDLIICPAVVYREAAEQGKTPEAHFAHLTIHGTLHLMGYDHIDDHDAEIMETLEIHLLNQLAYPNPYAQDEA